MDACPRCGGDLPAGAGFCPTCGGAVAVAPGSAPTVRRTVTVVFCDLSGSTALGESHDPELMRAVVTRYFATVAAVLERHGGTVEKFIGDAVVAVFGVPHLHEDDAVRAVRAAAGARDAVAGLNEEIERDHGLRIAVRLGVETGEVVVGDGSRGTVATGDAVNVAARLEQAAPPGEVLVGAGTWRLVRDWATGEELEPLALPGKATGVAAWRLLHVENERRAPRRIVGTPLVGRDRELALLRQTLERSVAERSCHLVTLLGTAGVGKTRLLGTLLESLPGEFTVLRGRCLSYGDAVGLWPVREILRTAAGISGEDGEKQARERLAGLLPVDDEAPAIVERLVPLAGFGGTPPSREETSWALRRLLESMARRSPVVLVVDDLHWAEPALLDLLDHLADWIRDAPLLLVCLSRPELLDERPTWAGGRINATSLLLSPLDRDAAAELVAAIAGENRLAQDVADRIREAAAGVPLYAEHLFAMLVEESLSLVDGTWQWAGPSDGLDVPPTIAAILATRLDRLDLVSRTVLDAASVVGEVFYRGAVDEMVDTLTRDQVTESLTALVRRELLRPEPSDIAGEDGLRFVHILVRDAVYTTMSKARRADLHLRFARWLAKRSDAGTSVDAFVGHHLAHAVTLRDALGPRDPATRELADEAVTVLERASARVELSDETAAAALLERAAQTAGNAGEQARLHLRQSALLVMDNDLGAGGRAWLAAKAAAERARDPRLVEMVGLDGYQFAVQLPGVGAEVLSDEQIDSTVRHYRDAGDDEALLTALRAAVNRHIERGQWGQSLAVAGEFERVARRLGDVVTETRSRLELSNACVWGPVPAAEARSRLDRLKADPQLQQLDLQRDIDISRACILAMLDRAGEARSAIHVAEHAAAELHTEGVQLSMCAGYAWVLLGDLPGAEAALRRGAETLSRQGEVAWLSTMLPMLGEVRLALGDEDEAWRCAERARDMSPPGDIESQARWRSLLARLEARRGRHGEAQRLATEAVQWITRGDQTDTIGDRHRDLAEVVAAAGRQVEARVALEAAIAFYRSKGNIASERRALAVLDAL